MVITSGYISSDLLRVYIVDINLRAVMGDPSSLQPAGRNGPSNIQPAGRNGPSNIQPATHNGLSNLQPVGRSSPSSLQLVGRNSPSSLQPVGRNSPSSLQPVGRNGLRSYHKELRLYSMDSVDQFVKIHGTEYLGRFLQVSRPLGLMENELNCVTAH